MASLQPQNFSPFGLAQNLDLKVKPFVPFPLQKLLRYYDFIRHHLMPLHFRPNGVSLESF
jgi:hypothetical protein